MDFKVTELERAFELAKSGDFNTVHDLKKRLREEGFTTAQICGPALLKQIRGLIAEARRASA